jgi:hypothetical protein
MFNYFTDFTFLSITAMLAGVILLASVSFFFIRLVVFYKKGNSYFTKSKQAPKISDVHMIFLAVGIIGTLIAGCIPFVSWIVCILSIIAFFKVNSEILDDLNNLQSVKPEKMILIGMGLGIAGALGLLLGFYRGSQEV